MKLYFAFFIMISLFSCGRGYEVSECSKKCDRLIRKYCRKPREDGLIVRGTGGGLNRDNTKVNLIELSLTTDEFQDIDSARRLIVTETGNFLDFINKQNDFRDCMIKHPYPTKNLHIFILCEIPENHRENYIRAVGLGCDDVQYYQFDDSRGLNGIKLIHEETYEEAKQTLADQNPNRNTFIH